MKERLLQTREVETPLWDFERPPGRSRSRQKRSGGSEKTLRGNCLHCHHGAWHLPPLQHLWWPLLLVMGGSSLYRDRSPRTKDPGIPLMILLPRRRPSKASRSPLPFPLKKEAERVASVHTLFEVAIGQNKPSSRWVYDRLKKFFPRKTKEHLVYFSNVLCITLSEFHLTSACSPLGMCALVLLPVVEAELPPLENYLHEDELGLQDIHVCCIAAIKQLGAWLHPGRHDHMIQ